MMISNIIEIIMFFTFQLTKSETKEHDDLDNIGGGAAVGKACVSGLAASMPPVFCWKKGADFGVIPSGCPSGYWRSLALCYQHCRGGYSHWGGVCWQTCARGYSNHGLTCYKNFFRWYFKSSYIPSSITNFSSRIPCPGDMYKSGALCYRNCSTVGMYNCGIGACVNAPGSCATEVTKMILQVIEGVVTGVATVLTFGASAAAKAGAKTAIKAGVKAGSAAAKSAAKAASKALKKLITGQFKEFFKDQAVKKVKTYLKDKLKDKAQEIVITNVCKKVFDTMIKKTSSTQINEITDAMIDTLDIFGVKAIVKGCGNTKSDGGLACAKGVTDTLATFDPTGLLTIASAFMHPSCDVPVSKPVFEKVILPVAKPVKKPFRRIIRRPNPRWRRPY
jgi:hypothetical protein